MGTISLYHLFYLTLYPLEAHFNAFAIRSDLDQAELPDEALLCWLI